MSGSAMSYSEKNHIKDHHNIIKLHYINHFNRHIKYIVRAQSIFRHP